MYCIVLYCIVLAKYLKSKIQLATIVCVQFSTSPDRTLYVNFSTDPPTLVVGTLLTGTNYNKQKDKSWGGKNGYGAKLASIFSIRFGAEKQMHSK